MPGTFAYYLQAVNEDQFLQLFKYIELLRREMHVEFALVHARIDSTLGLVDAHEKRLESLEQERLIVNHQLNLHEVWIRQSAAKIAVPYRS